MEGLKKFIREKIEEKKREIMEEGEREKIKLLDEFEEEKKREEREARAEIENLLRLEEVRRISRVQLENLNKILKKREEILEDLVLEIKKEVKRIKWKRIFPFLLKEAIERFGEKKGVVKVNKDFLKLAQEEIKKNKLDFKIISEKDMEEGVIVESEDGRIRVYNTFLMRLERARDYIFEVLKEMISA